MGEHGVEKMGVISPIKSDGLSATLAYDGGPKTSCNQMSEISRYDGDCNLT
jgi:hypothetical protein